MQCELRFVGEKHYQHISILSYFRIVGFNCYPGIAAGCLWEIGQYNMRYYDLLQCPTATAKRGDCEYAHLCWF